MPRVLLVGLMATGKSSVAQAVSSLTGWPSVDNDELLEAATGRTAAQLLEQEGLQRLRRAESDVLAQVLELPPPLVAGVAAGVVLDAGDRDRLRAGGHVVWLRASVPTLVARIRSSPHRPFLDTDLTATLEGMEAERSPLFAQVAAQVLDMDALTPAQAAAEVLAAVRG